MNPQLIATLGPNALQEKWVRTILQAGATALRINLAHADDEWLEQILSLIQDQAGEMPVIADIPGKKLRTGDLPAPLTLLPGQTVQMVADLAENGEPHTATRISLKLPTPWPELKYGTLIGLRDQKLQLSLMESSDTSWTCKVIRGGEAVSRMGIAIDAQSLTALVDWKKMNGVLSRCIRAGVHHFLLSFCETVQDVMDASHQLTALGLDAPVVIPKIETAAAVAQFETLTSSAPIVCLARGDLGMAMTLPDVALAEWNLLDVARKNGCDVIIAGEVLPGALTGRITRPEALAVFYEVRHGAAGFILSDETAMGGNAEAAVRALRAMIQSAGGTTRSSL